MNAPLLSPQDWPAWPMSIRDLEDPNPVPWEAWEYAPDRERNPYEHLSPSRFEGLAYVAAKRVEGLVMSHSAVVLKYSGHDYRIPLARLQTEVDLIKVVFHLAGKSWMNGDRLRYFIERVAGEVLGLEGVA